MGFLSGDPELGPLTQVERSKSSVFTCSIGQGKATCQQKASFGLEKLCHCKDDWDQQNNTKCCDRVETDPARALIRNAALEVENTLGGHPIHTVSNYALAN